MLEVLNLLQIFKLTPINKIVFFFFILFFSCSVLNNYLIWKMVQSFISYLSKPFRDAHKDFIKALLGLDFGQNCVLDTDNAFGSAIGAMFVRAVYDDETKPKVQEMINSIRLAFKENLKNLKWMDPESRKLANEKVDAISDIIGFPDYILNPQLLDEQYKMLEIDPNNYFENNIKLKVFDLKKNLEKLDQLVNKTELEFPPSMVNAFYVPTKNKIYIPAGILQPPFYDISKPKSSNFGGIGTIIGHEVSMNDLSDVMFYDVTIHC